MIKYNETFKRPFTDIKSLIIGTLLNILPIVNLLVIGFILKSVDTLMTKRKNFALPAWENWGDLFIKGLMAFIISLIYMIPALIFLIIAGVSVGFSALISGNPSTMSFAALGTFGLIGAILALLAAYIIPSALLAYEQAAMFGAAFNGEVFRKAFTGNYALPWIIGIIVSIALAAIFNMVWFIGPAFAGYVGYMILFSLIAQNYAEL